MSMHRKRGSKRAGGNGYLFLDFDGVFHPIGAGVQHFQAPCVQLFSEVLRMCPGVPIVVSSTWRCAHSLEELRGFFPEDVGTRMVGTTPELLVGEGYYRYKEIKLYLEKHASPDAPWVALDDNREMFPPACDGTLVITDSGTGLTPKTAMALYEALKALSPG